MHASIATEHDRTRLYLHGGRWSPVSHALPHRWPPVIPGGVRLVSATALAGAGQATGRAAAGVGAAERTAGVCRCVQV